MVKSEYQKARAAMIESLNKHWYRTDPERHREIAARYDGLAKTDHAEQRRKLTEGSKKGWATRRAKQTEATP